MKIWLDGASLPASNNMCKIKRRKDKNEIKSLVD